MTQADLPAIRQLAKNSAFSFSDHAYAQMLNRGITYDDVESILTSSTNQIIECQFLPVLLENHTQTNVYSFMILVPRRMQSSFSFCCLFLLLTFVL